MSELPALSKEQAAEADKRHEEAMVQEKLGSVVDHAQEIYDHSSAEALHTGEIGFGSDQGLNFKEAIHGQEIEVCRLSIRSDAYYELISGGTDIDEFDIQKVCQVIIATIDKQGNYVHYELSRGGGKGAPVSLMADYENPEDYYVEDYLVLEENGINIANPDPEFPYLDVDSVVHLANQAMGVYVHNS